VEIHKARVSNSADQRLKLLLSAGNLAYRLFMVRYIAAQSSSLTDNDNFHIGLSTRAEDQAEDALAPTATEMLADPSIFGIWSFYHEAPTNVGVNNREMTHPINFPKEGILVPYLALVWQQVMSGTVFVGVELYFEREKINQLTLAAMVLSAGGRARSASLDLP